MPRVTPVDPASAEGRAKELLTAVKASLGATPNMTTTMARSAVLEGWLGLNGALHKGSVLAFAEAVPRTTGGVNEADVEAARRAGFTDAQLGDVVGHVAVNVLTNLFNRTFAVDVDFPVVESRQHALAS